MNQCGTCVFQKGSLCLVIMVLLWVISKKYKSREHSSLKNPHIPLTYMQQGLRTFVSFITFKKQRTFSCITKISLYLCSLLIRSLTKLSVFPCFHLLSRPLPNFPSGYVKISFSCLERLIRITNSIFSMVASFFRPSISLESILAISLF